MCIYTETTAKTKYLNYRAYKFRPYFSMISLDMYSYQIFSVLLNLGENYNVFGLKWVLDGGVLMQLEASMVIAWVISNFVIILNCNIF